MNPKHENEEELVYVLINVFFSEQYLSYLREFVFNATINIYKNRFFIYILYTFNQLDGQNITMHGYIQPILTVYVSRNF